MLILVGIGFVAGLVTSLSPCVLPVLPILLAGSAAGGTRRPYAIVAGLVSSFVVFTLFASWLLARLGLPQDFLRNVALVLLLLLAATLIVPRIGEIVQRPLARLARRPSGDLGGGFLLGASLGLVFVPCAGPVLAAVTVVAATQTVGAHAVALTLAYALGAAVPMLAVALGGGKVLRTHARRLRPLFGVVIALTAVAIALNVDRRFQTAIPGYTQYIQEKIERSDRAQEELGELTSSRSLRTQAELDDFGPAPEFVGIVEWLNSEPLTMAGLRGKVVLVDFWTYSCINCLRTLPYLKAWDREYRDDGLVIVGVHSPEFAFERVPANVRSESRELGVRYPVALDNDFATWSAWQNQYWPSKYLVDRKGHVRYVHFGEGEYVETERAIQELLGERGPTAAARVQGEAASRGGITPETYLGYNRLGAFVGDTVAEDKMKRYRLAGFVAPNHLSYGGEWQVEGERILAGRAARLRIKFRARDIHLVLAGRGTVRAFVDGAEAGTTAVRGDRLYTLLRLPKAADGLLELRFSPGLSAYAFTFG